MLQIIHKSQAGQHHRVVIGALGYAILFVPLIRETLTLRIKLLHLQIPKFTFLKHSPLFPPYRCPPVNAGRKIGIKSFKKKILLGLSEQASARGCVDAFASQREIRRGERSSNSHPYHCPVLPSPVPPTNSDNNKGKFLPKGSKREFEHRSGGDTLLS